MSRDAWYRKHHAGAGRERVGVYVRAQLPEPVRLISAGMLPDPKRLRVGVALKSVNSWRLVLYESSTDESFKIGASG